MATTVHIPAEILKTVDAQARKRKVSRNKYIVEALVARVAAERQDARWPLSFLAEMKKWREDAAHQGAVAALKRSVAAARRSRKPVVL